MHKIVRHMLLQSTWKRICKPCSTRGFQFRLYKRQLPAWEWVQDM